MPTPRFPCIFSKVRFSLPRAFKKKGKRVALNNGFKWFIFLARIKRVLSAPRVLGNRYSVAKSCFLNKKPAGKFLGPRKFKEYQYAVLFRKVSLQLPLSYCRKKRSKFLIARNRFFEYRRRQRNLKKKKDSLHKKKLKYSFFFLSFRKKKYKRRSSRSSSRKFFTNVWLVAFIFTRPIRIKKVWYTKLLTRRVLSFFCTNFW